MIKAFLTFSLLFLSSAIANATEVASKGEQLLQSFLNDTNTMQAAFSQVLRTREGEVLQQSEGMFYLQRGNTQRKNKQGVNNNQQQSGQASALQSGNFPGKFRWDYQSPHEQVIVSDGRRIWMHDVELNQVTVQNQQASLPQTPMALLEKNFDLYGNYHVESLDDHNGVYRLKLKNKDANTDFGEVVIGVSQSGLQFLQLHDQFEQVTDIVFNQIRINQKVSAEVFRFIPPAGADIFGS